MKVARIRRGTQPRRTSPLGIGGTDPQPALDDLSDVDIGSPADGDVPTWDSGTGTWVAGPGGGGPDALHVWRPVTVNNPALVTTDGSAVYVPLVDGFGNAVMVWA